MYYFKEYVHNSLRSLIEAHGIRGPFLEVGCGRGENLVFLGQMGFTGVGIDLSESALEAALGRVAKQQTVRVARRDLFSVEGQFDFVLCMDVLEHIQDESAALGKLTSLLKGQHSHLILGVPGGPYMADDVLMGHFRRYHKHELVARMEKHGLEVIECVSLGFPFLYYARIWINRLRKEPVSPITSEELALNTLKSDVTHHYHGTFFGTTLDTALSFRLSRWLIHALLRLQEAFARGSKAHTFIVVASPRRAI
jgi:SAM-dependent methyltransferase